MVFSGSARSGVGMMLPCHNPVRGEDDLFVEADLLAIAEGLGASRSWRDFGVVGILCNHSSSDLQPIIQNWPKYFQEHISANCKVVALSAPREAPSIREDGFLNIDWPKSIDLGVPNSCDILLATATAPTLSAEGAYPTAAKIAQAWLAAKSANYFKNNVLAGIRAADDAEIWRHIEEAAPHWIETTDYKKVGAILQQC
jgi:hypothetical protein